MLRNCKLAQVNLQLILIMLVVILTGIFLGRNIVSFSSANYIYIIFGLVLAVVTLLNTEWGIFVIVISMLLSPEVKVGSVPGRDIVVRLEDFLLMIVTFSWLVKTAIYKELGIFKKTPLNLPILIYILVSIILTMRGMLIDKVGVFKGAFYVLKYIEYFVLYFMVVNHVSTKKQVARFIFALLLTCCFTSLYANIHIGKVFRLSAPFEGTGEPNTLGGYTVIMLALAMGILLYSSSVVSIFWLVAVVLFTIPTFLFTLSRTSYISIIPMWITLIILGTKKWLTSTLLFFALLLSLIALPNVVKERINYTFTGKTATMQQVAIGKMELDPSASARIITWKEILGNWINYPVFGCGITGCGFTDGQYVLLLGEMGLIGMIAFIFLLWSIFRNAKKIFSETKDSLFKGIALGFLAGFVGLLFFNFGANGFILTRIMEPFWFMAAIVMMIPEISQAESGKSLQNE